MSESASALTIAVPFLLGGVAIATWLLLAALALQRSVRMERGVSLVPASLVAGCAALCATPALYRYVHGGADYVHEPHALAMACGACLLGALGPVLYYDARTIGGAYAFPAAGLHLAALLVSLALGLLPLAPDYAEALPALRGLVPGRHCTSCSVPALLPG